MLFFRREMQSRANTLRQQSTSRVFMLSSITKNPLCFLMWLPNQHHLHRRFSLTYANIFFSFYMINPPLGLSTCPVINDASGDAKNAAAAATSSGVPTRPSGVSSQSACIAAASSIPFIGVSITPGARQFTRMWEGPISCASAWVIPINPALAVEYRMRRTSPKWRTPAQCSRFGGVSYPAAPPGTPNRRHPNGCAASGSTVHRWYQ